MLLLALWLSVFVRRENARAAAIRLRYDPQLSQPRFIDRKEPQVARLQGQRVFVPIFFRQLLAPVAVRMARDVLAGVLS